VSCHFCRPCRRCSGFQSNLVSNRPPSFFLSMAAAAAAAATTWTTMRPFLGWHYDAGGKHCGSDETSGAAQGRQRGTRGAGASSAPRRCSRATLSATRGLSATQARTPQPRRAGAPPRSPTWPRAALGERCSRRVRTGHLCASSCWGRGRFGGFSAPPPRTVPRSLRPGLASQTAFAAFSWAENCFCRDGETDQHRGNDHGGQ